MVRDLVETFDCVQMGAAKYSEGIFARGEDWVSRACSADGARWRIFVRAGESTGVVERAAAR